jgi:hypothetical protein
MKKFWMDESLNPEFVIGIRWDYVPLGTPKMQRKIKELVLVGFMAINFMLCSEDLLPLSWDITPA